MNEEMKFFKSSGLEVNFSCVDLARRFLPLTEASSATSQSEAS